MLVINSLFNTLGEYACLFFCLFIWQTKSKAEGKSYDKPNIVSGANV